MELERKEYRPLSATSIYYIASHLAYLRRSVVEDMVVYEDGSVQKEGWGYILFTMKELKNYLDTYNLASLEVGRLSLLIREFEDKYVKGSYRRLDKDDHEDLLKVIDRMDSTIRQEIVNRNFTEMTPVGGLLNYSKLISEGVGGLVGERVDKLPEIVKHDLDEAIRSMAFGAPTASVMVALRAVEGMLRMLCSNLTGKKADKPWGDLLLDIKDVLEKKQMKVPSLLGYLDYMRDIRNQADHPDKVFELREAEHVLMHTVYIILEIGKQINHKEPEP